jgi:hypothetical protein
MGNNHISTGKRIAGIAINHHACNFSRCTGPNRANQQDRKQQV